MNATLKDTRYCLSFSSLFVHVLTLIPQTCLKKKHLLVRRATFYLALHTSKNRWGDITLTLHDQGGDIIPFLDRFPSFIHSAAL